MSTTQITRTEQADTITYTAAIDGAEVSELVIDSGTRKVVNIETLTAYRGQGIARSLWTAANAEAECYHAVEHHRTDEGNAFAQAVGGETIAPELDHIDSCYICETADDDDDSPYGY